MGQPVEFSVIVPTYNRLDLLKQAIRSIWTQTLTDYEIVVVDDGSTDGTMDYLRSLGPGVTALSQANAGPGAARNLGVRHAAGRYVAFLDSDDVWFPWTLATFHQAIHKHQLSLITGTTVEFEGSVPSIEQDELKLELFDDYFQTANNPAYIGSGVLVVERSTFYQTGGFDEGLTVGEDFDFYFRAGMCRGFVRVRAPVTLGYRRHGGNVSAIITPLYSGAVELLSRERNGRYPGGKVRQRDRWELLSRMIRPVVLSCLNAGLERQAWGLYWQSFVMNARLARFRFLAGFVVYWVIGLVRQPGSVVRKELGADKK
jgi:glycosyltransferase involved in cell wall biosynthesis